MGMMELIFNETQIIPPCFTNRFNLFQILKYKRGKLDFG
jgi:hypothetical protein